MYLTMPHTHTHTSDGLF